MTSHPITAEVTALCVELLARVGCEPADLIVAREAVQAAIRELRVTADELEQRAIKAWPEGRYETILVQGLGTFVKGTKADQRRWDDKGVARATVDAALALDKIDHPVDVVDVILGVAHIDNWRQKDLAALRVEWKPYLTKIPGQACIHSV